MATLKDVIEQLKANNRSEAGRDSTHTNEMRMSREANNQSFAELQEAITGTRSAIADQADNQPSASRLEEDAKEDAVQTARTNTLLQKIAGGIGGILGNVKQKAKAVGGGLLSILKGTLLAGFFFALAKFLNSPLYGQIIDYLTGTLIPKLQFFYDSFFGEGGGFMKGFEALFSDDSGIGSIVLGLAGVTAIFAGVKIASMFKKLKSGTTALLNFFKLASTEVGPLGGDTSKQKKGTGVGKGKPGGGLGSFGKNISSAGKGVGGFISGILKGIASGLAAIAAPPVLIGLAAVSAAAIAIGTAIRIMSPAFEPIGKMFESFGESVRRAFDGLGEFVKDIGTTIEGVINQIGKSIGDILDKISNLKTASTEAQTKQIKELSNIPADKLTAVADGVDRLKKALEDFGGGTFSQVVKNLFGGDGPLDKIVELTKKVDEIMRVAEAIDVLAKAGGQYEVAKAELERRKRITELEKELVSDTKFIGQSEESFQKEQEERRAEIDSLKKQSIDLGFISSRNMGGRVKAGSMYLVNESGSELFIPDQPGMMMSSARTAQLMREGSPDRRASAPNININAPSDNKVTQSTSNTTSNTTTIVNTDPILQAAMS